MFEQEQTYQDSLFEAEIEKRKRWIAHCEKKIGAIRKLCARESRNIASGEDILMTAMLEHVEKWQREIEDFEMKSLHCEPEPEDELDRRWQQFNF